MAPSHRIAIRTAAVVTAVWLLAGAFAPAHAQSVRLSDGRVLTGRMLQTTGIADQPDAAALAAGQAPVGSIWMVDDELRRIYVPKGRIVEQIDEVPPPPVKITPWQNPSQGAGRLISVGPSLGITPFDEYGRRIYEMQSADGPLAIVQGITELTPYYAKVEALVGPQRSIAWESRIATSSIPRDTLDRILTKAIPQDDWRQRLQAVRFYSQAQRYPEARRELERIIEEFPDQKDLQSEVAQLSRLAAAQLLKELGMRRAAGQDKLVRTLLENFPVDQVSGETLVEVRELTAEYAQAQSRIKRVGEALTATVAAIKDADHRKLAEPIAQEIIAELSRNTVARLAPFIQLLDDSSLTAEEKSALAISGWLLGADGSVRDMTVAVSLVKIRAGVVAYLREPTPAEREPILNSIVSMEGATIEQLAELIAHMKPPWHEPELARRPDGYLELSAPGQTEDGDFRYLVQLPPEYDPYRLYPTLVVLNGAYNSPEQELDFWAGSTPVAVNGAAVRRGEAMRRGYITIAVDWHKPHQYEYEFSAREHIAVLTSLRDATRRFSVDADRVFLSGHDVGGKAAWDMAQSHPDLWAGAISFCPRAEKEQKYLNFYYENARFVPLYFIAGELDGRTIVQHAPVWNKYLRNAKNDVTLIEYQGRGHEPFHDEIKKLFEWMNVRKRTGPPPRFACNTLRPWDNFFWWVESEGFPPQFMVHPTDWAGGRVTPAVVEGWLQSDNRLSAKSNAEHTTIWLGPDFVDFSKPLRVLFNGRKMPLPEGGVQPSAAVLLEDVRTRGDRQRPFWAKLEATGVR